MNNESKELHLFSADWPTNILKNPLNLVEGRKTIDRESKLIILLYKKNRNSVLSVFRTNM